MSGWNANHLPRQAVGYGGARALVSFPRGSRTACSEGEMPLLPWFIHVGLANVPHALNRPRRTRSTGRVLPAGWDPSIALAFIQPTRSARWVQRGARRVGAGGRSPKSSCRRHRKWLGLRRLQRRRRGSGNNGCPMGLRWRFVARQGRDTESERDRRDTVAVRSYARINRTGLDPFDACKAH